jgi:uncharacterized membrane protein
LSLGKNRKIASEDVEASDKKSYRSNALQLALISVNAALYAVAITITSPVPTPWGVGHFRPGAVVPAFFSAIFGPVVGGVGAAIGCFLGDFTLSFFGLSNPLLSLIAGVPGNFVGFYLLGWLISKGRSLAFFILSNFVSLLIGNIVAALGVLAYFWFIVPDWALWPIELKMGVVIGLTLFWVVTMIVFIVPLVPLLAILTKPTFTRIGLKGMSELDWGNQSGIVGVSGAVALVFVAIHLVVVLVPGGSQLVGGILPSELLLISAAVVFASGLTFSVTSEKIRKFLQTRS